MSDYLPDDVLDKILLLLPLKCLVRFCCVSKSWKSHITSFDFIHAQLNCTKISTAKTGKNLLLLKYNVIEPQNEQYSLHFDNDNLDLYKNLNCPFHVHTKNLKYFRVLGSVNGLVCLEADRLGKINHFVLWNPSISKHLILPKPQFMYWEYGPYDDAIGLGFDSRNNDYKVVRLFFKDSYWATPMVEIFKLSTRSWETIAATIGEGYWFRNSGRDPVYLNGVVYWSVYKIHAKLNVIVSFDVSSEVFDEILLPPCYDGTGQELHVGVYCECLSLICYGENFIMSKLKLKEIWVLKDGLWTNIYTVDLLGAMEEGKTIAFMKNGDFLRTTENGQLVSYDFTTKKHKYFDIFEHNHRSSFYVGAYEESLVLLGNGNISGNETVQAKN